MPNKKSKPEPTGDDGAREAEVLASTQALGEIACDIGDEEGAVVANLTAFMLEQFKHRPKSWSELSQSEQRDLAAVLEHNAKEAVRAVVEAVARNGREPIRAMLESYTEKDGVKVTLKVKPMDEKESLAAVVGLHKAQGKTVLITVASADDYHDRPAADQSEPEQAHLGFEAGSDEHPDDDSDLAGEPEPDPMNLRDGDKAAHKGSTGNVRINLKTGWVQFLESDAVNLEGNWQDMREASAEELAAERERTADFVEEPAE